MSYCKSTLLFTAFVILLAGKPLISLAKPKPVIQLSTINWEPYTGEHLLNHGFFSDIVTQSFSRMGYGVKYHYYPWARALEMAKAGRVDGLMTAYYQKQRAEFFDYPSVVWQVKEEFVVLANNPIPYSGELTALKDYPIGTLIGSAQGEDLQRAGLTISPVSNQVQNIKMLLSQHIKVALMPRNLAIYHLPKIALDGKVETVKFLSPPFKVYDMYVVFSKQRKNYQQTTKDFNQGLSLIKQDGTFEKILKQHNISYEVH